MFWRIFVRTFGLLLGLGLGLGGHAYAAESPESADLATFSYGDLYVAQSTTATRHKMDLLAGYGVGLGIPQYTLQSAVIGLDFWLGDNTSLGLRGSFYHSSPSELETLLEERLSTSGVSLKYSHPVRSLQARAGYSPLRGLVNLFGSKVVDYSFVLGAGLGTVELADPAGRVPSVALFAEQKIQLFSNAGFAISYSYIADRHELGRDTEWLGRSQMETGFYARF